MVILFKHTALRAEACTEEDSMMENDFASQKDDAQEGAIYFFLFVLLHDRQLADYMQSCSCGSLIFY